MASNALPPSRDLLFALADECCAGLETHEVTLGIKQNTAPIMRAVLAAAQAAESAFGQARLARREAYAALAEADLAGRVLISNARRRLAKFFGEAFSAEWNAAGWPNGSTAVPRRQDECYALVCSLQLYYTAHPEHESTQMDATAAEAEAVWQRLASARSQVLQAVTQALTAKQARDATEASLRRRLRCLISELDLLIEADDWHWYRFGLNRPADETLPEVPGPVTITQATPGTLLVQWQATRRAQRYRVWQQVEGTDEGFVSVLTPYDTDATLTGLPSGSTVRLRATALNKAGESRAGPDVLAVVG